MKLSSRKQLLSEAAAELNRVRKINGIDESSNSINERTAFQNGKFELDRYEVEYGGGEVDPLGNWCLDKDVKELESLASEMYAILKEVSYRGKMSRDAKAALNLGPKMQKIVDDVLNKAKTL